MNMSSSCFYDVDQSLNEFSQLFIWLVFASKINDFEFIFKFFLGVVCERPFSSIKPGEIWEVFIWEEIPLFKFNLEIEARVDF